jgi:hypothetical protein
MERLHWSHFTVTVVYVTLIRDGDLTPWYYQVVDLTPFVATVYCQFFPSQISAFA